MAVTCNLLQENGSRLLQENGDRLLIENCVEIPDVATPPSDAGGVGGAPGGRQPSHVYAPAFRSVRELYRPFVPLPNEPEPQPEPEVKPEPAAELKARSPLVSMIVDKDGKVVPLKTIGDSLADDDEEAIAVIILATLH